MEILHFYVIWDAVAWVFVLFIETKNTPLEEIAKIFDGEDAVIRSGLELTKKNFKVTQKEIRLAQMMMLDTNGYKFALFLPYYYPKFY